MQQQHSLNWFVRKKLLVQEFTAKNLAQNYAQKARTNIITAELLDKAPNFKEILALPQDYNPDEWVVIASYYAMYMAALSVLAKLGYKSKNHTATILALEEYLVKKKLLDQQYVQTLQKIKIKKEEIQKLEQAKDDRETAQYSVTKQTTKNISQQTKQEAHAFINKMEEIYDMIE